MNLNIDVRYIGKNNLPIECPCGQTLRCISHLETKNFIPKHCGLLNQEGILQCPYCNARIKIPYPEILKKKLNEKGEKKLKSHLPGFFDQKIKREGEFYTCTDKTATDLIYSYEDVPIKVTTKKRFFLNEDDFSATVVRCFLPGNQNYQISISKKNVLSGMAKLFGQKDHPTDFEDFDNTFVVNTKDKELISNLLTMGILTRIMDLNLSAMDNLAIIFKEEIFVLILMRQLTSFRDYDIFIDMAQNLIENHKLTF